MELGLLDLGDVTPHYGVVETEEQAKESTHKSSCLPIIESKSRFDFETKPTPIVEIRE